MGKKSREKHTGLSLNQRVAAPRKINPDSSAVRAHEKRMRKQPQNSVLQRRELPLDPAAYSSQRLRFGV